jgi:hypothetical protein
MNIIKLYNNKLREFGENDFRSMYWGDKEGKGAKKRYSQMKEYYNWDSKSVLEIGCGWGSFFDFGFSCKKYLGIDINTNFISLAKEKYPQEQWKTFNDDWYDPTLYDSFDVCISSGVAGNRGGPAWHPGIVKKYLSDMFNCAQTVLVNFPSNRSTIRSEYVEYFSPEYILGEALNITYNTQIIHKSKSDFLLIMKHG